VPILCLYPCIRAKEKGGILNPEWFQRRSSTQGKFKVVSKKVVSKKEFNAR
jgi:hypothetical protein